MGCRLFPSARSRPRHPRRIRRLRRHHRSSSPSPPGSPTTAPAAFSSGPPSSTSSSALPTPSNSPRQLPRTPPLGLGRPLRRPRRGRSGKHHPRPSYIAYFGFDEPTLLIPPASLTFLELRHSQEPVSRTWASSNIHHPRHHLRASPNSSPSPEAPRPRRRRREDFTAP